MSNIEKHISPLVESQFPAFYKEQGPLFILFVQEYYKWLEESSTSYANYDGALIDGNPSYHSRRLLEYKDIDKTVDDFIVYIKEKYLKNVQFETNISKKRLLKATHDLFGAKGSKRSFELFFNLVYGTRIEIYSPGDDILKPSDGTWVIPIYLELTRSSRTADFVGKQVTGSTSNATAFVEYVITRNINGKLIDLAFLSNLTGNFTTGEVITDNEIILDAPKIIGSLTGIDITLPGVGFTVGETVLISSSSGVEGKALVSGVDAVTGVVQFTIIYGGWGFSNTAETTVSDKTISVSNVINNDPSITEFIRNETISQNLYSFNLSDVPLQLETNSTFNNGDTSTPSVSVLVFNTQNTATSYTSNTANIVLNQISSNVHSNTILYEKNRAIVATNTSVSFSIGDVVVQRTSSTNNVIGIVNSVSNVTILTVNTTSIGANGIHVGTYLVQTTTGATGYVTTIPRENYFTHTNVSAITVSDVIGTFNGSSIVTSYPSSTNATALTTFTPLSTVSGYRYVLIETNLTDNTRWSTSNTIVLQGSPTVNNVILIASDVGGKFTSNTNKTATANIFAQNTSHIGITSITNTFYATGKSQVVGSNSNTVANIISISTGFGADFSVGFVSDSEVVRLSADFISSNNDGPGISSIKFKDMIISGANSTYGNLTSVYIENGGTGYDNTNIVTFVGGNTGAGSFEAGNATIVTTSSGVITSVTLSANVGNGIISTPTVTIVNSTSGSSGVGTGASLIPTSALGFAKLPGGDITVPLIDLLSFNSKTIGTISSLTAINPGEQYNIDPFVLVYEPEVAAYGKRDQVTSINITSGPGFVVGEQITQTSSTPGITITSNNFSGNTNLSFEVFEFVYSSDGISNTATGIVYSTTRNAVTNVHTTVLTSNTGTWRNTINVSVLTVTTNTNFEPGNKLIQDTANGVLVTSNSTTLIVKDVQGTFQANSTSVTSNASPTPGTSLISAESNTIIFTLKGLTSKGNSSITNTAAYTASSTARFEVKTCNTTLLTLKRVSLFDDLTVGSTIIGTTSGTQAVIINTIDDLTVGVVGDNANILADVVSSEGRITSLNVFDSGYGYVNDEGVTITSTDGLRVASGQANVARQGIGEGYYSSTRGFLDDNKFIFDGDYYQNFSYEIQSSLPLDKYSEVLKQVLHISGNKLFGRVVISPVANVNINNSTTITIT